MLPTKSVNVRIPAHLTERYDALLKRFAGLPPSTVVRFIISDVLERSLDEQVDAINRQIQKPGNKAAKKSDRPSLNTSRRSMQL